MDKDNELTEGDITKFQRHAKDLGYVKRTKQMTAFQIFSLICVLSFFGSTLVIWTQWFVKSVQTGIFVFNWISFAETVQFTANLFVQVVLGKILNVLNRYYDQKKLTEELITTEDMIVDPKKFAKLQALAAAKPNPFTATPPAPAVTPPPAEPKK